MDLYESCPDCLGEKKVGRRIFGKKPCPRCRGTGKIYREKAKPPGAPLDVSGTPNARYPDTEN